MSKNNLYIVCAVVDGKSEKLYETTSEKKAYDYLHDYQRKNNDVERMYIDRKVITRFNKRDYIEDENF